MTGTRERRVTADLETFHIVKFYRRKCVYVIYIYDSKKGSDEKKTFKSSIFLSTNIAVLVIVYII